MDAFICATARYPPNEVSREAVARGVRRRHFLRVHKEMRRQDAHVRVRACALARGHVVLI